MLTKILGDNLNFYVLYSAGKHSSKLTNIGLIKSQSRRHVIPVIEIRVDEEDV